MSEKPDSNHLYRIAENQAGHFSANQARAAGYSWERLSYYATTGKFIRVKRGVYRLAQFPGSPFEDLFVAWLRTGSLSVISHESALYIHRLSDVLPGEVHVTIPRTGSRRRKSIRLHTKRIHPDEVVWREGLPVTNAARTIIDLADSGLAEEQLRMAVQEALRRGLFSEDELRTMATHLSGRARNQIMNILTR